MGVTRIAFSLDGLGPEDEAPTVRVSLFALDQDRASPRSVQYARFIPYDPSAGVTPHGHANASVSDRSLPIGRGIYVVPVRFTSPGLWGVLLEMSTSDNRESVRLRFSVRERQAAPGVGDRAPLVDSRTRDDVSALNKLTSDPDPEPGTVRHVDCRGVIDWETPDRRLCDARVLSFTNLRSGTRRRQDGLARILV